MSRFAAFSTPYRRERVERLISGAREFAELAGAMAHDASLEIGPGPSERRERLHAAHQHLRSALADLEAARNPVHTPSGETPRDEMAVIR